MALTIVAVTPELTGTSDDFCPAESGFETNFHHWNDTRYAKRECSAARNIAEAKIHR